MTPQDLRKQLSALNKSLRTLEQHLIGKFLRGPLTLTIDRSEVIATSAYIVLAHAAFEQFFEEVALWLLQRAINNWTTHKRLSRTTACLLLAAAVEKSHSKKVVFDQIRLALEAQKTIISRLIKKDNHGISQDHLRDLFLPLGLDMPSNPTHISSLDKLTEHRGSKAHLSVGATLQVPAKDAKRWVDDCRDLASDTVARAVSLRT